MSTSLDLLILQNALDFFLSEYPKNLPLGTILQSLYDDEPLDGVVTAEVYEDWYPPFLAERISDLFNLQKRLVKEVTEAYEA